MKTHIYFVPGLAASSKIFENILLPEDKFELHFLEWFVPDSLDEPLEGYAKKMCAKITHENPILIGVSFGGVLVQEMSKIINPKKTILISSIKSRNELPSRLKIAQQTKAYKLLPVKVLEHLEDYEQYFFLPYLKRRLELYKLFLTMNDATYLKWAVHNVLNWKQETPMQGITHIHGDDDEVFPITNIKNHIPIKGGTHIMIINKAKTISKILEKECSL